MGRFLWDTRYCGSQSLVKYFTEFHVWFSLINYNNVYNIIILGYNLGAWVFECIAVLLGLWLNSNHFLLAIIFRYGISAGLTPLVYLFGAAEWRNK